MATRPHVGKGLLAGWIGGLVGTWAMSEAQALWSQAADGRRPHSAGGRHDAREWQERYEGQNANELAPQAVARATIGRRLTRDELEIAAPFSHYAFGSVTAAGYGALVEYEPAATAGYGTVFGGAVWAGADELAMPLLGLSRRDYPLEAHLQAFTAHLVYGVTTEAVRRLVRRAL